MIPLYPLRFKPIFKEKIWGGSKLHDILGKDCGHIPACGESWELSAVKGNVSVVENGPLSGKRLDQLIHEYRSALVGKRVYAEFKEEFPLLIKFLDAQQDLSVQVHPDDELAMQRHEQQGKTEMWYIIQSDPGATLITGFNRELNKDEFARLIEQGRTSEVLNREEVAPGDVFFIPAGRIHTIGSGILLAEIQQTSDVTYRIYDFDRKDASGKGRELHIDEALDALDYTFHEEYRSHYEVIPNQENRIVQSPYFITSKINLDREYILEPDRMTFRILIIVSGAAELSWKEGNIQTRLGDVLLLPASMGELEILPEGKAEFLLVRT